MNVADVIAFSLIGAGFAGLLFVVFLKIHNKLLKQYFVHWEDKDGNQSYSMIKAHSKKRATRKLMKTNLAVAKTNKIARYRGE